MLTVSRNFSYLGWLHMRSICLTKGNHCSKYVAVIKSISFLPGVLQCCEFVFANNSVELSTCPSMRCVSFFFILTEIIDQGGN